MRKYLIIAAVAAMGALMSSCQSEKDIETPVSRTGEVSLVLGGIATRAEATTAASVMRNNYDLGEIEEGVKLTLEEIVTEMGDLVEDAAETRGTPAYTENVTSVYGDSFNGVIYGASGQVVGDGAFKIFPLSGKNCWRREIGYDPWEKAGGEVTFFLRMPATQNGTKIVDYNYADNSVSFTHETPASAEDQQDILFATRKISKETYEQEYKNGGASVLFRHALTGVKFAIGNNTTQAGTRHPDGEVQTFITKVEIRGLKDKGQAKFIPAGNETGSDNKTEYSSAGSFTWTKLSSTPAVFSQEFSEEDIQDYVKGDAVGAPDSFYNGGANRNLNKADASLTFWFIPQDITADLQVDVTVKVWAKDEMSTEKVLKLNLGEMILAQTAETNKTWKAGQLRTFTLKPNVVNVTIDDDVNGYVKKNVVITNTGNVDAYIRANITANWYGTTDAGIEGVAAGYTDATRTTFVAPWELNYPTGDNYDGEFTELPGTDWIYAKDGYFYYKNPVAPGAETGSPLFKQYTNRDSNVPDIYYLSATGVKLFSNIHMVMDLTVQAVEAKSTHTDFKAAWADAGVTVEERE